MFSETAKMLASAYLKYCALHRHGPSYQGRYLSDPKELRTTEEMQEKKDPL